MRISEARAKSQPYSSFDERNYTAQAAGPMTDKSFATLRPSGKLAQQTPMHGNHAAHRIYTRTDTKTLRLLLIGCGPHAQRVYLPALHKLHDRYNVSLKAVIELKRQRTLTETRTNALFHNVEFLFTDSFNDARLLPASFRMKLDELVEKHGINGVIIATEPLSHMQYALWAARKGLHILMDKPISTRKNVASSLGQAQQHAEDFELLIAARDQSKAFIINAQRRYHPGFKYVLGEVMNVAQKYRIPITAMQSTHCDGQWRLPKEILTQEYHPYFGYGKVSHSGYHLIDIISRFVLSSSLFSEHRPRKLSVLA